MVNVLWVSLALLMMPPGVPMGCPVAFSHAAVKSAPAAKGGERALETLCDRLLDQARLIDRQLRGVTDLASANEAADKLDASMAEMLTLLRSLEELPPTNADEAQRMSRKLSDLVRISQNYMALVARITEVNAYGSDRLMKVFAKYKVLDFGSDADGRDTLPSQQAELLEEMGDRLEDVLYLVRKVQDKPSAQSAVQGLSPAVMRLENLRRQLDAQAAAIAASRSEEVREAMQRLRRLQGELRDHARRLKASGFYDVPVLEVLLRDSERCCL